MPRSGATVKNQADGSGVGDVRYSMLTEAEFQSQNGTNWVLMDGRNVSGSRYAVIKGVSVIPDHRGLAPRMKNNGRSDGSQDPGGERALGNFQDHANASHSHTQAAHTHQIDKVRGSMGYVGGASKSLDPSLGTGQPLESNITISATPVINPDGGSESRMRNLALNAFIKVN